jgi:hypothetical protein
MALPAEVAAGLRDREEILAQLDAPTRAILEAEAKGDHGALLEMIGDVLFFIHVDGGTPTQLAELINRRYEGVDDVLRPVDVALAIARGEETAAAKAERQAREVEERREFIERARMRHADDNEIADVPEVSTTH